MFIPHHISFMTYNLDNCFLVQVEQLLDEKHKVVGKDPSDTPVGSSTQVDLASMSTPIFEGAPSSVNPSPMEAAPPG